MKLVIPAGQGDWVFMMVKLHSVREHISAVSIVDGWPYRSREFVELTLPGIPVDYEKAVSYHNLCRMEDHHEYAWTHSPTWEKIMAKGLDPLYIEANRHLEHGIPVSEWLPDLPYTPHFPLLENVSADDKAAALEIVARAMNGDARSFGHPMKDGPVVGISCASYRGAEAWKTWGKSEWVDCLKRMMDMGWRPLLMGGQWDDLTHAVACELELPDIVGKTSVHQMVAVLDLLDSYIGFSSGMTMTRTVIDKPAFALWPDHQVELSRSWAPPDMIAAGTYEAVLWRPVDQVWPVMRQFLRRSEKGLEDEGLSGMLREVAPFPRRQLHA